MPGLGIALGLGLGSGLGARAGAGAGAGVRVGARGRVRVGARHWVRGRVLADEGNGEVAAGAGEGVKSGHARDLMWP